MMMAGCRRREMERCCESGQKRWSEGSERVMQCHEVAGRRSMASQVAGGGAGVVG